MPFQVRLRSSAAWATPPVPASAIPASTAADNSDFLGARPCAVTCLSSLFMIIPSGQVTGQETTEPAEQLSCNIRLIEDRLLQIGYSQRPAGNHRSVLARPFCHLNLFLAIRRKYCRISATHKSEGLPIELIGNFHVHCARAMLRNGETGVARRA